MSIFDAYSALLSAVVVSLRKPYLNIFSQVREDEENLERAQSDPKFAQKASCSTDVSRNKVPRYDQFTVRHLIELRPKGHYRKVSAPRAPPLIGVQRRCRSVYLLDSCNIAVREV